MSTQKRQHTASQKDLLAGAGDPLGFHAGPVDPAYSSRGYAQSI